MTKLFVLILLSASFASAESQTGFESIRRISVRAESRVGNSKMIHIDDVAELTGFETEDLVNLKLIDLIEAPKSGERRRFTNIGFAQILRSKLKNFDEANKIVLNIPSEVLIVRKSARLETSEIEAELLSKLKSQCVTCEYEISSLVLPIVNQDLSGAASWKIKIENLNPKGSFSIPLEVSNEDGTKRVYWLGGSLTVRKNVPVAKHNLTSGENVKEDDFNFEKKDITYLNEPSATQEDLKSAVAGRNLQAGQIISVSSIRKPSIVRVGENVKVFMGEDGWQVSIDGIAQQNAYKGDLVKVKILRTQKTISGIATDKGMVEIR